MVYDFRKSLENDKKQHIPQGIINELNSELPAGYKYQQVDDRRLQLVPTADNKQPQYNISMKNVEFKNLPKKKEFKDFSEVLDYATEHNLVLEGMFKGTLDVTVGEKKDATSGLIYNPLENSQITGGEFIIKPNVKTVKWDISVGAYRREIIVLFKRTRQKFYINNAEDTSPIKIEIIIDLINLTGKFNISLDLQGQHKITEVLELLNIQYGLLSGAAYIDGKACFWKESPKLSGNFDELKNRINWWEKIQILERQTDDKFLIQFPMSDKQRILLQALYINIIMDKPFKEYIDMDSFRAKFKNQYTFHENEQLPPLILTDQLDLKEMGSSQKIYRIRKIYNLIVKTYEKKDNEVVQIYLKHDDNFRVYMVTKMCLSEDKLKECFENNTKVLDSAELLPDIKVM